MLKYSKNLFAFRSHLAITYTEYIGMVIFYIGIKVLKSIKTINIHKNDNLCIFFGKIAFNSALNLHNNGATEVKRKKNLLEKHTLIFPRWSPECL